MVFFGETVTQRSNAGQTALDCSFVGGFFVRCQRAAGIGVELGPGYFCCVEKQNEGVAGRFGAEVW